MKLTHEFEVELENGKQCVVEVEAFCEYDNNYGADADGLRGVRTFDVTDEDVIDIHCSQVLSIDEREEASTLALKMSCDHDWESMFNEAGEE